MQAFSKRIVLVNLLVCAIAAPKGMGAEAMAFRSHAVAVPSSSTLLSLRGGDVADGASVTIQDGMLSADNLAAFYGVNGLLLGTLQSFAPDLAMKLLHSYEAGTPSNKAARLVGANMYAYGLIAYLSVVNKMSATKSMGWSLVPIVAHLLGRDVFTGEKSFSYQRAALFFSSVLALCATSLISGQGLPTDVAAGASLVLLGSIDILSILFPDEMMQKLEHTQNFLPLDYKLRFVTQAIGVHSLAHLSLFFALWRGKDPITAVGISALTTSILAVIVLIMGPNFRKSGAPLAPMIPFVGTYLFMSWKMLG
mmetsp:Transcript_10381/g.15779  ORF Transcript_10381/g.15779 Transcript_10381/m.15779 type:complete len:309 (-) Transcript_10381:59-985(-)